MNYITEINAFYDWAEVNQPRHAEISLWYALMHMANKSGRQKEFSVPISTLMIKTGLSKTSIEIARNKLQQKDRIRFKNRSGNQSAVYQMIPFVPNIRPQNCAQTESQSLPQERPQPKSQNGAIIKQNKTKQEKTKPSPSVSPSLQFYSQKIGSATAAIEADISGFLAKGMEEALIIQAIQKALDRNIPRWSYIKAILNSLLSDGITTADQWQDSPGTPSDQANFSENTSMDVAAFEHLGLNIPEFPPGYQEGIKKDRLERQPCYASDSL